jgi:hypothetical protein
MGVWAYGRIGVLGLGQLNWSKTNSTITSKSLIRPIRWQPDACCITPTRPYADTELALSAFLAQTLLHLSDLRLQFLDSLIEPGQALEIHLLL